jgi:hypothetical protein
MGAIPAAPVISGFAAHSVQADGGTGANRILSKFHVGVYAEGVGRQHDA